ncbi:single-stranded DNA-binding protein [Campylobacter lari]|uniref:Single-stranded DNA-binding protein n=1 Tax=Campylobacter lari TaxID=201 RepID=A0A7U8ARF4_CAMLA|nr:single-stranded DNA-binding protein [Campylobacter lari]EAI5630828.1 single-stranded DNA-binding protein [Campylobacter lari]EAJ1254967.1 single-stranded DNA-binding protein [Campylobacter lari]EAL3889578.1 single-stranded DNA-binding protein [Campylobacter lari]EAL7139724.1 single-stranded DNA-binding protein [Campylobacter lari]EGJ4816108.1 single-stranded DNA-binding protein [Campylobacter lari]
MNEVVLCGFLGKDWEVSQGKKELLAKNSLAITTITKKANEEIKHTDWIPLVVFGTNRVNALANYLKKGDKFLCKGRIFTSVYEDENQNKRTGFQVIVDNFEFVHQKEKQNIDHQVTKEDNSAENFAQTDNMEEEAF